MGIGKSDPEEGKKVLGELLGLISEIGEELAPFMPATSEKIKEILASGKIELLFPRF